MSKVNGAEQQETEEAHHQRRLIEIHHFQRFFDAQLKHKFEWYHLRTLRFRFQALMKLFLLALKEFASLHNQMQSRSNKLFQKQADMGKSGFTTIVIPKAATAERNEEKQHQEKDQEKG